ncbi:MAG: FAD-dependent oxidoreductase [Gemmatimonadaceae bacterium]|jgi:protoporphyrinogen oxidase|nr:FAD-dependent oxidoreductase [Gemmatimonadaceae bacterium]
MVSRRAAIAAAVAVPAGVLLGAPALVGLLRKAPRRVTGGFVDDGSAVGHALRDGTRPAAPARRERVPIVILGGGVSGLGAAWALAREGLRDFVVLESAREAGGNARSGEMEGMRHPWGAHYLPVPDARNTLVRELCTDIGLLRDGVWDERALAFAPQERLFQHGTWHEGIEPSFALTRAERDELTRFDATMAEWRARDAFAVPSVECAARTAREWRALDRQTMGEWLTAQGYRTPALRWLVDYGVRDDYGASLETASAWAGVHYFAGRPAHDAGPLTWPEGNAWLIARLLERVGPRVRTNAPVWRVGREGARWTIDTADIRYEADAVIAAMPVHALARVLDGVSPAPVTLDRSPWLVANVLLDRWPEERGLPVAWDNVIYDSPSLGYVVATHQSLRTEQARSVWTWYHAPVERDAASARRWLRDLSWGEARDLVLNDLRRAHPDIDGCVARVDVLRYGHAMPRPTPGFLDATAALRAWQPGPRFALAHTDASGLSLFEEALERGVSAARQVREALRA